MPPFDDCTGNSDSMNGCNCVYDEMIDELTDNEGNDRTEYWKYVDGI